MDRTYESGAAGSPPSAPASPSSGYPTAGNPQTATPSTKPGPWWYHMMTEELRAVIVAAGLTPDHEDVTQLAQAIQALFVANQKAVVINSVTFEASVADGEVVRWDSANNRFDEAVADGTANNRAVGVADVTNSKVYLYGECPLFSGLTPGARYYLDGTAAGAITSTAPTTAFVLVGIAKSATVLWVDVDAAQVVPAAAVQGAFKNLAASATGTNASVVVTCDEIALEDAANSYVTARTVSLAINTAAAGANGLDAGSLAASTWYSVWVIRKPDGTTAGLLSLSATAPTLPGGYTHKARVGWIRTDGTANKYPLGFIQYGRRVQYKVAAGSNLAALPILASGAAGNTSTPTWVAVSIAAFAPPTASAIEILLNAVSYNNAMAAPNNSYGSYLSTTNPPPMSMASTTATGGYGWSYMTKFMAIESANIYWASSGMALLATTGWEDNL